MADKEKIRKQSERLKRRVEKAEKAAEKVRRTVSAAEGIRR